MKRRYLIRYSTPALNAIPYDFLHEYIGGNIGNLVYTVSLMRLLMVDGETEFITPPHHYSCSKNEIDRINQTCSGFIINLADALRDGFEPELREMTLFIKKLRIPCVIIGCGLRAPYEPDPDLTFGFDKTVYDFFSAVLDKSDLIGLRGEITGRYAKKLGFREGKDYTVIGCPSMYMYGDHLSCKDTYNCVSSNTAQISINLSPRVSANTLNFMTKIANEYPNATYMPQNSGDCTLMYYGIPRKMSAYMPAGWPCSLDHPFICDHNVHIYNHPSAWMEYLRGRDLSVGTRMHGNITAVLAGTPALFLPQDARTRELCEFHDFAHLSPHHLEKYASLSEAIQSVDFNKPILRQKENFNHFRSFLKSNNLPSIYEIGAVEKAPFDQVMERFSSTPPMDRFDRISPEEAAFRRKHHKKLYLKSLASRAYKRFAAYMFRIHPFGFLLTDSNDKV